MHGAFYATASKEPLPFRNGHRRPALPEGTDDDAGADAGSGQDKGYTFADALGAPVTMATDPSILKSAAIVLPPYHRWSQDPNSGIHWLAAILLTG